MTKKDRRWTLSGDPVELATYNLDRPYDDEVAFIDQLSCYLLAKQKPVNMRPA